MSAPEILDTQSPYWLRLYGRWVHLNGIMPVVDTQQGRAFSELVTVDGYRHVYRAPRGPRTWELSYRWGTAAATAALESAAYDNNFSDPLTRTLFMDRDAARVNMVDPDLVNAWGSKWAPSGVPAIPGPQFVLNVGEDAERPIWLPTYDVGDEDTTAPQIYVNRAYYALLPGVVYTAAVWTRALSGYSVLRMEDAESGTVLGEYFATGGSTNENPELATVTFTAPDNNPAGETVLLEMGMSPYNAGLMLYEGDCPPEFYRAGRRMPCQVSVQDPALTSNLMHSWGRCDPCKLPREHATFTVQEVGVSAGADLVVT